MRALPTASAGGDEDGSVRAARPAAAPDPSPLCARTTALTLDRSPVQADQPASCVSCSRHAACLEIAHDGGDIGD
jgi:hypothetical protein